MWVAEGQPGCGFLTDAGYRTQLALKLKAGHANFPADTSAVGNFLST